MYLFLLLLAWNSVGVSWDVTKVLQGLVVWGLVPGFLKQKMAGSNPVVTNLERGALRALLS